MTFADDTLGVFTTCKPFRGADGVYQHLALKSWADLALPVMLIGNDEGTADAAALYGFKHAPVAGAGYPTLGHLFETARAHFDAPALCYMNADILLPPDAGSPLGVLAHAARDRLLLATARRRNLPLPHRHDGAPERRDVAALIRQLDADYGAWDGPLAIDMVLFSRALFADLPALKIGRMGWDNWALWQARAAGAAVVDASADMALYHPIHEYGSGSGGWRAYWSGDDVRANLAAVGERRLSLDDATTHYLQDGRLRDRAGLSDADAAAFRARLSADPDRSIRGGLKVLSDLVADRVANPAADHNVVDVARMILWRSGRYAPFRDLATPAPLGRPEDVAALLTEPADAAAETLEDWVNRDSADRLLAARAESRPIYVHGTGGYARRALPVLRRLGAEPDALLTPAAYKTEEALDGVPVQAVEDLMLGPEQGRPAPMVLVASGAAAEILDRYRALGLSEGTDVLI